MKALHPSLNLLLFICVLLCFNSCCKSNKCKCQKEWGEKIEDCTPKHYGPYPLGGAYDYLYFERGSWWVYKNDLTGERDSIYTEQCDTGVVELTGRYYKWLSSTYTTISFRLRSDIYNVSYGYYRFAIYPDVTNYDYTQVQFKDWVRKGGVGGPGVAFVFPFRNNADIKFKELISVLNIKGVDYQEVAVFETERDFSCQVPITLTYPASSTGVVRYYWAKGVGVVLMEAQLFRKDTEQVFWQKWELEKSHLIQ